jgi:hypothetical protein
LQTKKAADDFRLRPLKEPYGCFWHYKRTPLPWPLAASRHDHAVTKDAMQGHVMSIEVS